MCSNNSNNFNDELLIDNFNDVLCVLNIVAISMYRKCDLIIVTISMMYC